MNQRKHGTKRQRTKATDDTENRETEDQRTDGTENRRDRKDGAIDGAQVTEESPPLAARVNSLSEAVKLSLSAAPTENDLFIFARALLAFTVTTGHQLSASDRDQAFTLWWNKASSTLPADARFDEYRLMFLDACSKAKVPLGANPLEEAVKRADAMTAIPYADRYSSPRILRLVAVCCQLQALQGNAAFYLSVRDAARFIGSKGLAEAAALMNGLVQDRVLSVVFKGSPGGKKATRYIFNAPPSDASAPSQPPDLSEAFSP